MTATPEIMPRSRLPARWHPLPVVLAATAVVLQICYPLMAGQARDVLTVITVVTFFAASAAHALVWRGAAWAALLVTASAGTGLLVEALGTATGVPFGEYRYANSLGWQVLDVPVVIPLAWAMMAYPALLVSRRLVSGVAARIVVAAVALASWDLFLDPQMVDAGHWRWTDATPALPGVPGVPLSNYAGWLVTALVLMTVLTVLLPEKREHPHAPVDDRVPYALYLWTYVSSVLANLVFFGRPVVALVGGVGMGVVALPLARRLLRDR